jgi:hypothetical protein
MMEGGMLFTERLKALIEFSKTKLKKYETNNNMIFFYNVEHKTK